MRSSKRLVMVNKSTLIVVMLMIVLISSLVSACSRERPHRTVKDLCGGNKFGDLYIYENGVYIPFIVVTNDYDGKTLLLRKEILELPRKYNTYDSKYEYSSIDDFLNSEYIKTLTDQNLIILNTDIEITTESSIGFSGNDTTTIARKIFLLSYTEIGYNVTVNVAKEGTPLQYFKKNENRIAYLNCEPKEWWLRTPDTYYLSCVYYIGQNASIDIGNAFDEKGVRPAFCVSSDALIERREDIVDNSTVYVLSEQ